MIDGGITLFLIGIILACAAPAERAMAQRRSERADIILRPHIASAFPFMPPSPALDQLAREAEAALDEDDLARGVRRLAAIYDTSADD